MRLCHDWKFGLDTDHKAVSCLSTCQLYQPQTVLSRNRANIRQLDAQLAQEQTSRYSAASLQAYRRLVQCRCMAWSMLILEHEVPCKGHRLIRAVSAQHLQAARLARCRILT